MVLSHFAKKTPSGGLPVHTIVTIACDHSARSGSGGIADVATRSPNSKLRKMMSQRAGAAVLVGACLSLGVYTAVAEGNAPEADPVSAMNDVLFVGVVGALIDSTPLDGAITDLALADSAQADASIIPAGRSQ